MKAAGRRRQACGWRGKGAGYPILIAAPGARTVIDEEDDGVLGIADHGRHLLRVTDMLSHAPEHGQRVGRPCRVTCLARRLLSAGGCPAATRALS